MSAPRAWDDWRDVGGVLTHARVAGRGADVVLVPGLGCSALMFEALQRRLATRFRVWAYDPPGHGLTGAPRGTYLTIHSLAEHLEAWLDAAGLGGSALLGHSQGAEIIVDVASRRADLAGRVILCAPTGVPDRPNLARQALALLVDAARERPVFLRRALESYARAGVPRIATLWVNQWRHDTVPRLASLTSPVLVAWASADPVVRPRMAEAFAARVRGARLAEIPGGSHGVIDSRAATLARLVTAFVTGGRASIDEFDDVVRDFDAGR